MTTNEETIAIGGEKMEMKNNISRGWKNMAIGGAAGIMFGAGTAYAAGQLSRGNETAEEGNNAGTESGAHDVAVEASDVATVNEGQSFGEAFAQARAEVRPGGVFRWHGGVYGTYTKEEWDSMSQEEQRQFSQNAMSAASNADEGNSVHVNAQNITTHSTHEEQAGTAGTHSDSPASEATPASTANNDPDVHVVGVHDEQLADGSVVTVGRVEVEGLDNDILVVDVDRDSVFDMAISDINGNGDIDEGEIVDISDAGLRVPNAETTPNLHTAQNDIAPDMPDYMNDADVQMA